MQKSVEFLRRDSVQELFNEYYYDESYAALSSNYFSNLSTSSRNTAAAATTINVKWDESKGKKQDTSATSKVNSSIV